MTTEQTPAPAVVLAGVLAADLRRALTDLARRMEDSAQVADDTADSAAMDDFAQEIRDLVAKATPTEPAAGDDPNRALARAAARSVVEYVDYEGWYPRDSKTEVPDACADAVLAALTAAGIGPGYTAAADAGGEAP